MNANAAASTIPNLTKHISNATTNTLNTKVSTFNLVLKPLATNNRADSHPTQGSDIESPPSPLNKITPGNVLAFSKVTAALSAIVSARGSYAFRAGEAGRGPSAGKASDIQQVLPTTSILQTTPTVATNVSKPPSASTSASAPAQLTSPPPTPRQLTTIPIHPTKATPALISNSKRPTIIIYPTVSPESIVIPIVSCILGFPLLALMVICCLRRRAKLARERDRRRNYDMQDHAVSLVRFSPIHRLNNRSSRAVSLRPERSLSRGFPSLELDTVIEERSDPEQTQTDIISPESPLDPQKFRDFNSS